MRLVAPKLNSTDLEQYTIHKQMSSYALNHKIEQFSVSYWKVL